MTRALPPGTPVGVVGGGVMGAGIAQVAAAAGHPVVVLEVSGERAETARSAVQAGLERAASRGRADLERAGAVTATPDVQALAPCGLVVECVAEDLALKQDLLARLEAVLDPAAVLATNTSSLSVEALGSRLADPGRLVGMHFFNPAPVMQLVEVVSGLATSPDVAAVVAATAQAWGKVPVHCASAPGFLVNRAARPFYAEALSVVGETRLPVAEVDRLCREAGGFRLGPFEVMDLIGSDVNAAVTASVWTATGLDPRYRPSELQRRHVDAGLLGRKTGRGFHDPAPSPPPPRVLPDAEVPGPVAVGPDSPLRPLLARTGADLSDDPALGRWARLPGGPLVGLTRGDLAAAEAATAGEDVVLLDLALDWTACSRVGASPSAGLGPLPALLAAADVAVTALPDTPGLLLARTVALLVDEAVGLCARQGVPAGDLDTAVRLGLGYPLGPLAWGDRVGAAWVVQVLDALERLLPGGRFRVSPVLRRAGLQGTPLSSL